MIYELSQLAISQIEDIIHFMDKNFGTMQTEEYINGLYYSFELFADNPSTEYVFEEQWQHYVYRCHYIHYQIFSDKILVADISNTRTAPSK